MRSSSGGMRRAAVLCGLLAAAGPPAAAAEYLLDAPGARTLGPRELAARPPAFPFPAGERLEYDVSYFGIPVGTAALEVARLLELDGRRLAHVVATARTNDLFSKLYRVDDRTEGWIDLDRVVTLRTRTRTRHGSRTALEEVRFDWDTHYVHVREDQLHKRRRREVAFDFGPFVRDVFDAFYYLRALPLAQGFAIAVPTYASRKVYEFRVEVEGEERVWSPALGETAALRLRPSTRLDGAPYAAGSGTVFVAAGFGRVPLGLDGWIRTPESGLLVRGLRARLARYVAHAPGGSPPRLPALRPREWPVESVAGRPRWDPPPAVAAARHAAGAAPRDERRPLPGS